MLSLWGVASLTFIAGLAIGLVSLYRSRAAGQAEKENLRVELAQLTAERRAGEEKLKWAEDAKAQLGHAFKALASDALMANSEQLANRAKSELQNLVKPINDNLTGLDKSVRELEQKREGAYAALGQQLKQLGQMHTALQDTTTTLAQALKSPTIRGRWGEIQLRRLVEMAGLAEHVDFDEQQSGEGGRPDMIVHLPQEGILPIDSKVPLESYLEALETKDEQSRAAKLTQHAKALRNRVRDLSQKAYWEQFQPAPEVVVMFVPVEASLSTAFERDPELFEYAINNRVLITSPVVLFALLKVVAHGWQHQRLAENAARIANEGRELYGRMATFISHFADVGDSLGKSIRDYNKAVGSLEGRLLPLARRFEEMGVATGEIQAPGHLDTTPRKPTLLSEEGPADKSV